MEMNRTVIWIKTLYVVATTKQIKKTALTVGNLLGEDAFIKRGEHRKTS